ncbi:MAG TPA: glycosyltransferase [Burkholderiales bacterium]|nr:glycosyltransferase [Burkholderiales bacterium]
MSRGVAVEQFTPVLRSQELRDTWSASESDLVVLYVGRLAKEKNVGVVLSAFSAIQARVPCAKLVFVGDGPLRDVLKVACPQAIFVGVKTGKALAAHYASSDLFLFPSLTETFGNVVPEALASGLAVLSYDKAAAADLITHDHNGALAPPGEELEFINIAVALAVDPVKMNALRQQAAASVAHMNWTTVYNTFVNTLRAVIERHDSQFRLVRTNALPEAQVKQPNA